MVGCVIRNLNLRADSVASSDAGVARVDWRIVNTTTFAALLEAFAGEPVVAPACLSLLTVRIIAAGLSCNIGALQCSSLEAVFCRFLFGLRWKVAWCQELINQGLILAYAVCKHAAMVTVVIDAPLHIYSVASCVCDDGLRSPSWPWLVIVDGNSSVVSAWTTATNGCSIEIRPCRDRFEDRALGARVCASLSIETCTAHGRGEIAMALYKTSKGHEKSMGRTHDEVIRQTIAQGSWKMRYTVCVVYRFSTCCCWLHYILYFTLVVLFCALLFEESSKVL